MRLFVATCPGPVALLFLGMLMAQCGFPPQAWAAPSASTTTLAVTSLGVPAASVNWKSVVTLTGTVQSGGAPVTTGLVEFCDASFVNCTDTHLLGTAQLTAAGTAIMSFTPSIGTHSYKAVFAGTKAIAPSASASASLQVLGVPPTTATIELTGTPGDYTLETTINGTGSAMPTGTVAYLDTSNNNALIGTAELGKGIVEPMSLLSIPSPYSVGLSAEVAVADFNGDGFLDLAFVSGYNLVVLMGNGDGTFTTQVLSQPDFLGGYEPSWIVTADFNGDGIPDLAVLNWKSQSVYVELGNGDGTFTDVPGSAKVGAWPNSMVAGDFNGDGIPDLAVLSNNTDSVFVLLGNGDGTFTPAAATLKTGNYPWAIAAADFNGDGKLDLVVLNADDNTATVLLGNGDGTFTSAPTITGVAEDPESIAVADFNGDGKPDLAVSGTTFTVWLGQGDGTFKAAPASNLGFVGVGNIVAGDFNGDGIPDLAMNDQTVLASAILQGNGDGTFTPVATGAPYPIAAADLTGSGVSDLILEGSPMQPQELRKVVLTPDSISPIGGGTHQVVAVYSGDANNAPSTSTAVSMVGEKLEPSVTLSASASQVGVGVSDTLTATVTGGPFTPGATVVTPTGSVAFYSGATLLGSGALNSGGVATLATTALPGGTDSLTAVYLGDTNYYTETSNPVAVKVTKFSATVALTSSASPVYAGQSVTFTATLSGSGAKPTGNVTFLDGQTQLGTAPITAGVATYSTSTLAIGAHSITASYAGDSNYLASASSVVTEQVNPLLVPGVTLTTPTTTVNVGQPVTFTATLTGSGAKPTGSVTFLDGTNQLSTVALKAGVATYAATKLAGGAHSITASYSGDSTYQALASSPVSVQVNLLTSKITLTSNHPSIYAGQSIMFSANVSGSGATPTGTVTFLEGGQPVDMGIIGPASPMVNYNYLPPRFVAGSHTITAVYSGDSTYQAATSTPVTVQVNVPTATVKLTASASSATAGQSVTFTATVTGNSASPSGNVTFLDGATSLSAVSLVSGGAAYSTSLAPGTHSITASYAGDINYPAATSTAVSVSVTGTPSVKLTASPTAATAGTPVVLKAAVSGGAAQLTGTVKFYDGNISLGGGTLSGATATYSTSALSPGTHAITAAYSGDARNTAAKSPAVTLTVARATPAVLLSASAGAVVSGKPVTLTASVSGSGPRPTGTVTFYLGKTSLGAAILNSSGRAAIATNNLAQGKNIVTAIYNGDSNNAPESSPAVSVAVSPK
jgi:hypothetical protein